MRKCGFGEVRRGHRRGRNGVGGIGGGIEVEGRWVGGCGRSSGTSMLKNRSLVFSSQYPLPKQPTDFYIGKVRYTHLQAG